MFIDWLLVVGCCVVCVAFICCWLLIAGRRLCVWLLVVECWLLVVDTSVGCWVVVVGVWLLMSIVERMTGVGCRLMVAH